MTRVTMTKSHDEMAGERAKSEIRTHDLLITSELLCP